MKIKEVENLTGLTAKSIRLYETKGLLDVARNEINGYREYTEENVETLKNIKLYRYIGFSIDEIKDMLADREVAFTKLHGMLEKIKEDKESNEDKDKICRKLIDEKLQCNREDLNEYIEHINLVESEEYKEARRTIRDIKITSLGEVIYFLLIALGPILWLFYDIARERYERILLEVILSIISTILITLIISKYIKTGKLQKIEQKKANKGWGWLLISIALSIIPAFVIVFLISLPAQFVYDMESDNFILAVTSNPLAMNMLLLYGVVLAGYFVLRVIRKLTGNRLLKFDIKKKTALKMVAIFVVLSAALCYFVTANMMIITTEKIVIHSTFNPKGKSYNYENIEKIKVGYNSGGEVYYKISIEGKEYDLADMFAVNEKYEDTYDELCAFDNVAAKYKIKKEVSHKYEKYSDLDSRYKRKISGMMEN